MGLYHYSDDHITGDLFRFAAPWFDIAEGDLADDADDRGGITNHGICLAFLKLLDDKDHDGFLDGDLNYDGLVDGNDIKTIDPAIAANIYRQYFWEAYRCHQMRFLPALCLFDAVVNHKPRVAARLFQEALRVKADGVVGPATVAAANAIVNHESFLIDHLSRRGQFYCYIVVSDSSQATFLRGWNARLLKLTQFVQHHMTDKGDHINELS